MCTWIPPLKSMERIKMYATSAISREIVSITEINDHHKTITLSLN